MKYPNFITVLCSNLSQSIVVILDKLSKKRLVIGRIDASSLDLWFFFSEKTGNLVNLVSEASFGGQILMYYVNSKKNFKICPGRKISNTPQNVGNEPFFHGEKYQTCRILYLNVLRRIQSDLSFKIVFLNNVLVAQLLNLGSIWKTLVFFTFE